MGDAGRIQRSPTALLYVGMAAQTMASGVVFALLAELQDTYGLSGFELGVVAATFFVSNVTMQISLSRLADRGHSKLLLQLGLLAGVGGMLLFALASSFGGLVLARALGGAGEGLYGPAARRAAVNQSAGRPAEALGRMGSVAVAGFVLGPPLGAFLLDVGDLSLPFYVLAALLFICLPGVRMIPEPPVLGSPRGGVRALLSRRSVVAALLLSASLQTMFGAFEALWSRYFKDLGASPRFIGISLALFPLPMVALAARGGRLADRVGPQRAAVLANLGAVPVVVAYGLVSVPIVVVLFALINTMFQAVSMPGGQAAMANASPPELVATGQGLYGSVGAIFAAASALAAAPLYASTSPETAFACVGAAVAVLSLASWLVAGAPVQRASQAIDARLSNIN